MSALTLIIGDKTRSSWSLRPWLFLKHHQVPFTETLITLDQPDTRLRLRQHSPSGRVPVLRHGDITVWDSIAILEYVAETFALPRAWPLEPAARAFARSIAAEMHSAFTELRKELPFDARRKPEPKLLNEKVASDVARICGIWREARTTWGKGRGDWLFGSFGIADAMFAPVALRFQAYAVPLQGAELDYFYSVVTHPAVLQWVEAAQAEALTPMEATLERTKEIPRSEPPPVPAPVVKPGSGISGIKVKSVILPPD